MIYKGQHIWNVYYPAFTRTTTSTTTTIPTTRGSTTTKIRTILSAIARSMAATADMGGRLVSVSLLLLASCSGALVRISILANI